MHGRSVALKMQSYDGIPEGELVTIGKLQQIDLVAGILSCSLHDVLEGASAKRCEHPG